MTSPGAHTQTTHACGFALTYSSLQQLAVLLKPGQPLLHLRQPQQQLQQRDTHLCLHSEKKEGEVEIKEELHAIY